MDGAADSNINLVAYPQQRSPESTPHGSAYFVTHRIAYPQPTPDAITNVSAFAKPKCSPEPRAQFCSSKLHAQCVADTSSYSHTQPGSHHVSLHPDRTVIHNTRWRGHGSGLGIGVGLRMGLKLGGRDLVKRASLMLICPPPHLWSQDPDNGAIGHADR